MKARERLKKWRGDRTLAQAGEILGCDGSYVGYLERGERQPGRDIAERIRVKVGIKPTDWSAEKLLHRRAS